MSPSWLGRHIQARFSFRIGGRVPRVWSVEHDMDSMLAPSHSLGVLTSANTYTVCVIIIIIMTLAIRKTLKDAIQVAMDAGWNQIRAYLKLCSPRNLSGDATLPPEQKRPIFPGFLRNVSKKSRKEPNLFPFILNYPSIKKRKINLTLLHD